MKKVLKTKTVFNGRLLKVYKQRQRYPGGYVGDLEIVRHPGAVLIIPLLDSQRMVLIKQYRPVINAYIWEFPAGTLEQGESVTSCAKRELAEEISYQARHWKRLGKILPAPGYTTEQIVIFSARGLQRIESKKEADELITPGVFTPKQLKRMINSGNIVDAKTICALKLLEVSK
ncbi:NUDIX domain-containing protein [Candidatus Omnitrophota bacterium]